MLTGGLLFTSASQLADRGLLFTKASQLADRGVPSKRASLLARGFPRTTPSGLRPPPQGEAKGGLLSLRYDFSVKTYKRVRTAFVTPAAL